MKTNANKPLLTIAYFGCILIMLALVVTLIIGLLRTNVALWVRICYIALAGLLVAVVIYDCVSLYMGASTYIAGFILYALTVGVVIVCFVLYARLTINNGLIPTGDLSLYLFEVGNILAINILSIVIFCVGNINAKLNRTPVREARNK